MQGERTSLGSVPDLNQVSFPSNPSMDHFSSSNDILNPVETRLSNYMPASNGSIITPVSVVSGRPQSSSGWHRGESSSGANNHLQDQTPHDYSEMQLGWPSSLTARSGTDSMTENWSSDPSNFNSTSRIGNQASGRYSSNCDPLNVNSSHMHLRNADAHRSLEAFLPHILSKSGLSADNQISDFRVSTTGASPASSSTLSEINNLSGPSVCSWGSSSKRKTIEGTSGQFYPGGSSSSNLPMENMNQNSIPGCYTAPSQRNLSVSSEPLNMSLTNRLEHINSRNGFVSGKVMPPHLHSSGVPGISESSSRNPLGRLSAGHQEPFSFDPSRGSSVRNSNGYEVSQLPKPFSNSESLGLSSTIAQPMNSSNILNQSHVVHLSELSGSNPWNGSFIPRGGSSSSSVRYAGEGDSAIREEIIASSSNRSNPEFATFASSTETISVSQDQIDWSFAPGTSASSRNNSSASRIPPSSGGRSSPIVWLPHQMMRSQINQRPSDLTHWNHVSRTESDPGIRRTNFSHLPLDSFLDYEVAMSSLAQHQLDQRSAAFLMNMPSDDTHDWRALTAVEGRHRLQIRQVLNAMRRGVHLRPEDYMLIDPSMNGFAELHDRQRDLRLDVDNMSYEELLALEERIGNVSTGLSEEKILGSMKQRMYEATEVSLNLEPCCICQEDYVGGDVMGISDCSHEFHAACIKKWLMQKNLCPICKTTALET